MRSSGFGLYFGKDQSSLQSNSTTSQPIPFKISGAKIPAVPFPQATTALIFLVILFFFIRSFFNTTVNIEYLYFFLIVQILRYKIIFDLGKFWTTRILVINKPLIKTWLLKYLRHPNYLVVFWEVILICLFFNDFISLVFFSVINFSLICIRIFYEEKANKFRRKL